MNWLQLLSSRRIDKQEQPSDQMRSEFERDYDRIIFSHPFRSLQDKTQVIPLPKHDFVHTRLTHSLEVSSVGRSLGKRVGEVIIDRHPELKKQEISQFDFGAIVSAACLAHDIGNPPFGHSGEDAISDFFKNHHSGQFFQDKLNQAQWSDVTNFEGNAQGFRLLNKKQYQGLKPTFATLASFTKYPCESSLNNRDKKRISQKKYGFFQEEKEIFTEIASGVGLTKLSETEAIWSRHPLAFLVEAADDICYHIIDLEDGCRLGWVSYEETRDLFAEILGDRYQPEKLKAIPTQIERIGVLRAVAINELIHQTADAFLQVEESILSADFDKPLSTGIYARPALEKIIDISIRNIYRSSSVLETEASGLQVINGLMDSFTMAAYYWIFEHKILTKQQQTVINLMPEEIRYQLQYQTENPYQSLLHCIDFLSGLTDSYSVSLHGKLHR